MPPSSCTGPHVFASRGGVVETTHTVHAAVVSPSGTLLFHLGDPCRVTPVRSAIKPYQSLAVLETGAFEKYAFDDADLALMCSSHSSEDSHVARARAMLRRIQSTPEGQDLMDDDLACGGHESLSPAVNRSWVERRYHPRGIDNNCSGKHVGMMAAAFAMGQSSKGYEEADHPLQQNVMRVVQREAGLDETVHWGVDGCNLPTPAMQVRCLAKLYAKLTRSTEDQVSDASEAQSHLKRVYTAMSTHPEQVSGVGRFDYTLACASGYRPASPSTDIAPTPASLVGKLGADGIFAIAVPAGHAATGIPSDQAFGVAVKVEDGNEVALYVAVVEVLRQIGMPLPASASGAEIEALRPNGETAEQSTASTLEDFARPVRLNSIGKEVGRVWPEFQLVRS